MRSVSLIETEYIARGHAIYMRTCCEFQNCTCRRYVGSPDGLCAICMHGSCWHKMDFSQFESERVPARTPVYMRLSIVFAEPTVPPLPQDTPVYARAVDLIV